MGKTVPDLSEPAALRARLGSILKVVCLMFAIGYALRRGRQVVRRDVAMEAFRLARFLYSHATTASAESYALCPLLCFQASRFDARETPDGAIILLEFQDRSR